MKSVAIGLPAYNSYDPRIAFSLMDLTGALVSNNINFMRILVTQNPDIGNAHNGILERFLNSPADRLLIVDSDIIFDFRDALKLLLATDKDIVGANYKRKAIGAGWASSIKENGKVNGSLHEANMLATGFFSISKQAVEKLAKVSPTYLSEKKELMHAFVSTGPMHNKWVSTDEWLCCKWQELGETLWIDSSIKLGHVGAHEYR